MVVVATAWLASTVGTLPSSHRIVFVQSHLTVPHGWSAGTMTRTRASTFQAATDTRTVYGPDGLRIQLSYTPTVAQASGATWLPLRPDPFGLNPGNRTIATDSLYVDALWNATSEHRAFLTSTVETLHGTYGWSTSPATPSQQASLLRIYHGWHYPAPITTTEAVHAMVDSRKNSLPTTVRAWYGSSGAMIAAGLPATGEAAWYLFTTENHGKRWHLAYVSRLVPAKQRNGFPDTSPSDALVAMTMSSTRTIWIAQTINCMSGPESSGGAVTLARTSNDGKSWQRIANHIQEPAGYCPTILGLSVASQAKKPTVRLVERNATGTHVRYSWSPTQWRF